MNKQIHKSQCAPQGRWVTEGILCIKEEIVFNFFFFFFSFSADHKNSFWQKSHILVAK